MQSEVHRNLAQQERIQQGLSSGQLTNREAARLENGQARSERMQARAGDPIAIKTWLLRHEGVKGVKV